MDQRTLHQDAQALHREALSARPKYLLSTDRMGSFGPFFRQILHSFPRIYRVPSSRTLELPYPVVPGTSNSVELGHWDYPWVRLLSSIQRTNYEYTANARFTVTFRMSLHHQIFCFILRFTTANNATIWSAK